jgi:hypothetical protein
MPHAAYPKATKQKVAPLESAASVLTMTEAACIAADLSNNFHKAQKAFSQHDRKAFQLQLNQPQSSDYI